MSKLTVGSLFAGIGGFDLGFERAGMETIWQVEIDEYCRRVLAKHWPNAERFADIRECGAHNLKPVDLLCGGFPCQDISLASAAGVGIIGERSGLWREFARLVAELRPRFVVAENVAALRSRGLALVLQDLWALGFDAEWHCIPAAAVGAPHQRERIWIVAYPAGVFGKAIIRGKPDGIVPPDDAHFEGDGCGSWWAGGLDSALEGEQPETPSDEIADANGSWELQQEGTLGEERGRPSDGVESNADSHGEPLVGAAIARGERHAWTAEPGVVRMVHGIPHRVDRLRTLGNTLVPQIAEWIGRRIVEAEAQ